MLLFSRFLRAVANIWNSCPRERRKNVTFLNGKSVTRVKSVYRVVKCFPWVIHWHHAWILVARACEGHPRSTSGANGSLMEKHFTTLETDFTLVTLLPWRKGTYTYLKRENSAYMVGWVRWSELRNLDFRCQFLGSDFIQFVQHLYKKKTLKNASFLSKMATKIL